MLPGELGGKERRHDDGQRVALALQPRHQPGGHAAVQHARESHVPIEFRLEEKEPSVDCDGRSHQDHEPVAQGELPREQEPYQCDADQIPAEVRPVVVHQVRCCEPPGFAGLDGAALIAQRHGRLRAGKVQRDQQQHDGAGQEPVAEILTYQALEHCRPQGGCPDLL